MKTGTGTGSNNLAGITVGRKLTYLKPRQFNLSILYNEIMYEWRFSKNTKTVSVHPDM